LLFGLILMGVAIAVLAAADRQDAAADRARNQASVQSRRHTREREQTRINAMVHDDVMSVLLAASRPTPAAGLSHQAALALTRIDQLTSTDMDERLYPPEEVVAVLRSTLFDTGGGVSYTYQLDGEATVPSPAMAALTEALSEALRNSMQHAGDGIREVERSVEVVVGDDAVRVTVRDDGVGFSARQVSERRLGVRVSIVGRMRSLPGGDAHVTSKPDRGTIVHLSWTRP